ncbi:MAG TPA: LuxR C-terminal-related transcriptional regulator [Rubrobacteraceae bacterium]|nr:LuxR C-terminal-related transcriptional regulator [Rubrobacteraceae bacterium]
MRLSAASHNAASLLISEKTVGNHVSNIFTKLQVADRVQAIIRVREAGARARQAIDKNMQGLGFGGRRYRPLLTLQPRTARSVRQALVHQ